MEVTLLMAAISRVPSAIGSVGRASVALWISSQDADDIICIPESRARVTVEGT